MSASPDRAMLLFGVGAALVVGVLLYLAVRSTVKAGADVASKAVALVNPLSTENLAYQGVSATGAALTGDRDFSLGVLIWELTHADELAAEAAALGARDRSGSARAPVLGEPGW